MFVVVVAVASVVPVAFRPSYNVPSKRTTPGLTWRFREHDVVQFEIACAAEPALVATSLTDLTVDVAAVRISEFDFVVPITTVTLTEVGEDVVPATGIDARFVPPPPPPPHAASEIVARVIASVITTPFDFCLVGFTSTPIGERDTREDASASIHSVECVLTQ
jgi:hypothetical protein